jgi:type 1 glutamine amidotransferase
MRKLILLALALTATAAAASQKIVLIAGPRSHAPRTHEYNASVMLLAKWLNQNGVKDTVVVTGGWPEDEKVFVGARAVVFYMDGGVAHPLLIGNRLEKVGELAKKGVGLAFLHYAGELPKERGGEQLLDWIGGFYDRPYSQNPMNDADLKQESPTHPISRGWKSFSLRDEWYFRIRFRPDDKRLTPILSSQLPPKEPERQVLAWAVERADGGRGFGFTGIHFHKNWENEDFRRLLVNAVLWTAKVKVPKNGARCDLAPGDLDRNLFEVPKKK